MKTLFKTTLAVTAVLAIATQPAFAQRRAAAAPAAPTSAMPPVPVGTPVPGVAVANFDAAVVGSNAFQAAAQQRQATYKAQLDAYRSRGQALQAQLQPMVDKFNRDKAANTAAASLQQQAVAIQQFQESGQQEMNELIKPVVYSEAYAKEQIEAQLETAVRNALTSKRVSVLLDSQAVLWANNTYDLNPAIITELNRLVPSVQVVPPAGWEPRQLREQRAQQAQQGQAAPAAPAAPAGPPTSGR